MISYITVALLLISYIDNIQIVMPQKDQTEQVKLDIFWAILHTVAYAMAIGLILF